MNPYAISATLLGATTLTLVARGPVARWGRKVKRRKGGIYLWRVDHHRNRARRVTGYVGLTNSYYHRSRQHMGSSHYAGADGKRSAVAVKVPSQAWSDLRPRMYQVIPLPWWLCWHWIMRPLETLVILATWPVYNDAKNRWNPRRIPISIAKVHRMGRDQGSLQYAAGVWAGHQLRRVAALVLGLAAFTILYLVTTR